MISQRLTHFETVPSLKLVQGGLGALQTLPRKTPVTTSITMADSLFASEMLLIMETTPHISQ